MSRAREMRAQRRAAQFAKFRITELNLVPLVDILTSIVFFSLLTYQGAAMVALTSFDLALPPVVVNTPEQASKVKSEQDVLNLLLAVRVDNTKMTVEHSGGGGFRSEIPGLGPASLDQLQTLMTQIAAQYPQNHDVLVIPSDDVSYDNVIHVLERLKLARYSGISLGTRARATRVSAGGNGGGA